MKEEFFTKVIKLGNREPSKTVASPEDILRDIQNLTLARP